MQKIIHFIKYHNAFTIGLGLILLLTASAFANEDIRNTVIGERVETAQGIDNSQILATDLDKLDLNLQITSVNEDNENYYVNYTYQTLAIENNAWQPVIKTQTLTVSKEALGGKDLGLYVQEELSEVANFEISYLKEVQTLEKEKGVTKLVASIDYTGLIGLVLDIKDKILPGYKPIITAEVCDGQDNNRDGKIDEGLGQSCCGVGACKVCIDNCLNGTLQTCTPSAPTGEICDRVDNDCDGFIDEDLGKTTCGIGACQETIDSCVDGILQVCSPRAPRKEICNGIDDDCDGEIDEGDVCVVPETPAEQPPACQPAAEICNGIDDDCDGLIDENNICNQPATTTATTTTATTTTATTCISNWSCSDWTPSPETVACGQTFTQTRACTDANNCGTEEGKPIESQEATGDFCSAQNTVGTCQEGTCNFTCTEGFSDCNSDMSNGCETASTTCPITEP